MGLYLIPTVEIFLVLMVQPESECIFTIMSEVWLWSISNHMADFILLDS